MLQLTPIEADYWLRQRDDHEIVFLGRRYRITDEGYDEVFNSDGVWFSEPGEWRDRHNWLAPIYLFDPNKMKR